MIGRGHRVRPADQADRTLRPLARRALMMARPDAVAMRARKPWVRTRLMRLGWKVFIPVTIVWLFVEALMVVAEVGPWAGGA